MVGRNGEFLMGQSSRAALAPWIGWREARVWEATPSLSRTTDDEGFVNGDIASSPFGVGFYVPS
jgi:hypothetical protein